MSVDTLLKRHGNGRVSDKSRAAAGSPAPSSRPADTAGHQL